MTNKTGKAGLPLSRGKRSEVNKRHRRYKLEALIASNQQLPCGVPKCDRKRQRAATYCIKHNKRYREAGTPDGPIPTPGELRGLEVALRDWLQFDVLATDEQRQSFKLLWLSGQRIIRANPAFALPFYQMQGDTGLTAQARAWVILSHYVHRQRKPLSDAMLRYMAVCLWTEAKWQMPPGKKVYKRERSRFIDTNAGKFVLQNSGFSKVVTDYSACPKVNPWYLHDDTNEDDPITSTDQASTKTIYINNNRKGPICRAIGKEIGLAVEHAMGRSWLSDLALLARVAKALGLPF